MARQSRRKWEDSGMPIRDFAALSMDLRNLGGVWDSRIGRFMNSSWVVSQQFRYLDNALKRGVFHSPRLTEWYFNHEVRRIGKGYAP